LQKGVAKKNEATEEGKDTEWMNWKLPQISSNWIVGEIVSDCQKGGIISHLGRDKI
jgi:hypothetical protein